MWGNHFEYLPGVPVIAPVITAEIIDYLIGMRQHGAVLKKAQQIRISAVKVVSHP